MVDFYKLLSVKRNASKQEIKTAYREMVKKYHPDINKNAESSKIIISLNEAKEILLDDDKRKEYDLLLSDLEHSKQISKDKSKIYSVKEKEYKKNYHNTYITKWELFTNYLKNGVDSVFMKLIKSCLMLINLLFFSILRFIDYIVVLLIDVTEEFIDYIAGIIILFAILSLFITSKEIDSSFISFIPANIERFCILTIISLSIIFIKELIIKGSINLYVVLQNIENKVFIAILMK